MWIDDTPFCVIGSSCDVDISLTLSQVPPKQRRSETSHCCNGYGRRNTSIGINSIKILPKLVKVTWKTVANAINGAETTTKTNRRATLASFDSVRKPIQLKRPQHCIATSSPQLQGVRRRMVHVVFHRSRSTRQHNQGCFLRPSVPTKFFYSVMSVRSQLSSTST